ncbi:Coiled-coil domain-containing protein 17 [Nowakowskiella sp. JEL0407]|nr:Coiled-coil domain-containing protein 17 [Nowakowskiella sp. JEL0407]
MQRRSIADIEKERNEVITKLEKLESQFSKRAASVGRDFKPSNPNNQETPKVRINSAFDNNFPTDDENPTLMKELQTLRSNYLKNGGGDPDLLNEFGKLEKEVKTLMIVDGVDPELRIASALEETEYQRDLSRINKSHQKEMTIMNLEISKIKKLHELNELKKSLGVKSPLPPQETPVIPSPEPKHTLQVTENEQQLDFESLDAIPPPTYSKSRGFYVFFDFIYGLPFFTFGKKISISYSLFDGSQSKGKLTFLKQKECNVDVKNRAILVDFGGDGNWRKFVNVPQRSSLRLLIEFFVFDADEDSDLTGLEKSIGWTAIDIFNGPKLELNCGKWKVPVFSHPVNFQITTSKLYDSGSIISGYFLYTRIIDATSFHAHKQISVDISLHKSQYRRIKAYEQEGDYFSTGVNDDGTFFDLEKKQELGVKVVRVERPVVFEKMRWDVGIRVDKIRSAHSLNFPIPLIRIQQQYPTVPEQYNGFPAEPGIKPGTHGFPETQALCTFENVVASETTKCVVILQNTESDTKYAAEFKLFYKSKSSEIKLATGIFEIKLSLFKDTLNAPTSGSVPDLSKKKENPVVQITIFSETAPAPEKFFVAAYPPPIPEHVWIEHERNTAFTSDDYFNQGDSIILCIDGARYLPQNCTITKISGRIFDKNFRVLEDLPDIIVAPNLDSQLHSPKFFFQQTLSTNFPPSSTLLLKTYTLESPSLSFKLVGTSILDLFLTPPSQFDSKSKNRKKKKACVVLNEGCFQVPIFAGVPDVRDELGYDSLNEFNRVPCASVLLRLYRQKKDEKELIVDPPPDYSTKIYDSTRCTPTQSEKYLYYFVDKEKTTETFREFIMTHYKHLGISKPKTDKAMLNHLLTLLQKPGSQKPLFLDCSHISKYNQPHGISIQITSAQNLPFKGFSTCVLESLLPSTTPPHEKIVVKLNQKLDFTSLSNSPRWNDPAHVVRYFPGDCNRGVIVGVYCIAFDEGISDWELKYHGWTVVCPIDEFGYVKMKYLQIPLFSGKPPNNLRMLLMQGTQPISTTISEALSQKQISYTPSSSIFIKIIDARRESELVYMNEIEISPEILKKKKAYLKVGKSTVLEKMVPEEMEMEEFEGRIGVVFSRLADSIKKAGN